MVNYCGVGPDNQQAEERITIFAETASRPSCSVLETRTYDHRFRRPALGRKRPKFLGGQRRLLALIFVVRQHALRTLDALAEAILKHAVTFAVLDVSCDCQADYLRNRLTVDGCDRV